MDPTKEILKRPVREVMKSTVFWLVIDTPLKEAARAFTERQESGAPVCTPEGRVVGIVTLTDLVKFYGPESGGHVVADVMTPNVLAVAPDDLVERAVRLMTFERIHRVLVVDARGGLVGMISSLDILRELAGFPRQLNREIAIEPQEHTGRRDGIS